MRLKSRSLLVTVLMLLALHLLLLVVLFFAGGGWGALLTQSARERVSELGAEMTRALSAAPEDRWPAVLHRYSERHGVRFSASSPRPPPHAGRERPPSGPPMGSPPSVPPPDGQRSPFDQSPAASPPSPNLGGAHDRIELQRPGWWGPYRLLIPGMVDSGSGARPLDLVASADSLLAMAGFLGVGEWLRLALLAVGLSLLLWGPFLGSLLHTITRLRTATQHIAEGRFDARVEVDRRDELGALAESVNHMAARLDRYVSGQKQFLADVAHETISPLARMQVGLGLLEGRVGQQERATLQDVQEDAQQMSELLHELLLFSRAGVDAQRSVPQALLLRQFVEQALARENLEGARVNVDPQLAVLAYEPMLARALGNLFRNALRHAGGEGVELEAVAQEDTVTLWIRDRGPGVSEVALERLGEPFFRPDRSRDRASGGHGLGLAIVRRCLESCGGSVLFRNRSGGGFEAELQLRKA